MPGDNVLSSEVCPHSELGVYDTGQQSTCSHGDVIQLLRGAVGACAFCCSRLTSLSSHEDMGESFRF